MATNFEWSHGYARQADADFKMFLMLETPALPISVEPCHKLQFLQMACEKLVKAHLCDESTNLANFQTSHAYVARTLPVVLRQMASLYLKVTKAQARSIFRHVRHLAQEIEVLTPAVDRDGRRPDNCEYPWEDGAAVLHIPLDWSFTPLNMLKSFPGPTILDLIGKAINYYLS